MNETTAQTEAPEAKTPETVEVNGKTFTRARLLAALYNNARPLGMGILHFDPTVMTEEEAQATLDAMAPHTYFDYHKGRMLKTDVAKPTAFLYDRDYGEGFFASVIAGIPEG